MSSHQHHLEAEPSRGTGEADDPQDNGHYIAGASSLCSWFLEEIKQPHIIADTCGQHF